MALLLPQLRVSVIVPWVIAAVVAWIYLCKVGKVLPGASKRITSSHIPQPFPWSRLRTPMRYLQNTLVFVLCAVFAVVENCFAFQETSTTQLLSLLSLGGWLLALVYSVKHASSTGPKLPWRAGFSLFGSVSMWYWVSYHSPKATMISRWSFFGAEDFRSNIRH